MYGLLINLIMKAWLSIFYKWKTKKILGKHEIKDDLDKIIQENDMDLINNYL